MAPHGNMLMDEEKTLPEEQPQASDNYPQESAGEGTTISLNDMFRD